MVNYLGTRFDKATCSLMKGFSYLHQTKLANDSSARITELDELYQEDVDSVSLTAEFQLFKRHPEFRGCDQFWRS